MLNKTVQQGCSKGRGDACSARYGEPLSEARTPQGKKRVSARWGWAGEKSDFFSIL